MDILSDAVSRFVAIDRLSDLLDYAIKDHEASGLEFDECNWLKSDCGCLAGGVMYQTLGLRCIPGVYHQVTPAIVRDKAIRDRLDALNSLIFGHIHRAKCQLAGTTLTYQDFPSESWQYIDSLVAAKEALNWLRERDL